VVLDANDSAGELSRAQTFVSVDLDVGDFWMLSSKISKLSSLCHQVQDIVAVQTTISCQLLAESFQR
jgi:hypothetical protein